MGSKMIKKVRDIPIAFRRRAAQHLESIRGMEMGYGSQTARFGERVTVFYRPDIQGPAYYEFEVVGTGRPSANQGRYPQKPVENTQARGFIVLSANKHDFPITHWSLDRKPVSQYLLDQAADKGQEIAKFYKLDTLSYAAVDGAGALVSHDGQLPPLVDGLPKNLSDYADDISSANAGPSEIIPGDSDIDPDKYTVTRKGEQSKHQIRFHAEGAWEGLISNYYSSFAPLLEDLERRASEAWKLEALITEFGQGIMAGESLRIALLGRTKSISLSGEGRSYLVMDEVSVSAQEPEALILNVPEKHHFDVETEVDLTITYETGEIEKLSFFLVSKDTPGQPKSTREGA